MPEPSSPACMLDQIGAGLDDAPAPDAADWAEIRLWRKAKRAALLARRLAMSGDERAERSAAISAALRRELASGTPALLGLYWPWQGEYDPRGLHDLGLNLALPIVVGKDAPLIFRSWSPGAAMTPGFGGIPVPAEGGSVEPDLLLVPALGFDRRNYRLGYGGGFYDRTLEASRPRTIGIGFELGRMPTIYPQAHDLPLDLIITERS